MQKQKNSRRIGLILIVIIIAAAAVAVGAFLAVRNSDNAQSTQGIVLDDAAEDWSGETVYAGETDWKITLANPEDNNCYFRYTITIDDSETPIYESDLIEPGKAVREFEVTEPLEAGDYEIHLNVSTYTMDDTLTPMNGAVVKAVLHVV